MALVPLICILNNVYSAIFCDVCPNLKLVIIAESFILHLRGLEEI
jgi:hypothetical protein